MTDLELYDLATIIKNETVRRANTNARIGQLFQNLVNDKVNVTGDKDIKVIATGGGFTLVGADGVHFYSGTANDGKNILSSHQQPGGLQFNNVLPAANGRLVNSVNGNYATEDGNVDLGAIMAGTYTPSVASTENIDGYIVNQLQYIRIATCVTVSGMFNITSSVVGEVTTIIFELPFPSDFGEEYHCAGIGNLLNLNKQTAIVKADTLTKNAALTYAAASESVEEKVYFQFTYNIIQF